MAPPKALLLLLALPLSLPARALAPPDSPVRDAVGAEVDLLPYALSAWDDEVGRGLQLWAGRDRNRVRLVTTVIHFPDALTASPFRDRDLTAMALVWDRFLRFGFRGPWVGAGAEVWWTDLGIDLGPARRERVNPVATVGAGWVFPVWRGLYLNPWAAGHVVLGNRTIEIAGERYRMRQVEGEVSLKIGWTYPL